MLTCLFVNENAGVSRPFCKNLVAILGINTEEF